MQNAVSVPGTPVGRTFDSSKCSSNGLVYFSLGFFGGQFVIARNVSRLWYQMKITLLCETERFSLPSTGWILLAFLDKFYWYQ
jgi:hypothetical protein